MRFHEHLAAGALLALIRHRRDRAAALTCIAGAVLLDLDHYVLYAWRSGDWSPLGAWRYDRYRNHPPQPGDTRPRFGSLRSWLHRPWLAVPLWLLLAAGVPRARPFVAGMLLHLLLDTHWPQFDRAAWRRAAGRCEYCGSAHFERDVYAIGSSRAVWCADCARAVVSRRRRSDLMASASAQRPAAVSAAAAPAARAPAPGSRHRPPPRRVRRPA